jgi:hypothetical protein
MGPIMTPMPIERFLVPEPSLALPEGFARSRQPLTRGVPFQWTLDGDLGVALIVPTGFATLWRDADPEAIATASTGETRPHVPPRGSDPSEQPAVRLILRRERATLASIPLAAGLVRIAPDGDNARSLTEIFIAGWLLHAGCMRGPGDYGSFVDGAWRRADRSGADFSGTAYRPRGGYLP